MFKKLAFVLALLLTSSALMANGSAQIVDGRLKIQLFTDARISEGTFQLRGILEDHGYKNQDGFVATGESLAPLEIYNYLYEDQDYVFTILLPLDNGAFASMSERGFLSFEGIAAQKLFEVIKQHLVKREINNLEQYGFGKGSYCDATVGTAEPKYRCHINL